MTTITCSGLGVRNTTAARLSPFVLRRAFLSWGRDARVTTSGQTTGGPWRNHLAGVAAKALRLPIVP